MKKFEFNDSINYFEIHPLYLKEGLKFAKKNNYKNIRIRNSIDMPSSKNAIFLSLDAFTDSDSIEKLIIEDFKVKGYDISNIYGLKNMKHLSVTSNYCIDFARLPQLTSLHLLKYKIKNFQNINALINLKNDFLITDFDEVNMIELGQFSKLEMLRLSGGSFITLEGIRTLKSLKELRITYNNSLANASEIKDLSNLKKIHIENCKGLTNFSFLENNSTIEELFISEVDSLNFVRSMSKLNKINFWNCKDGDLMPLIDSKSLKTIFFNPEKKHYSHKKSEIVK